MLLALQLWSSILSICSSRYYRQQLLLQQQIQPAAHQAALVLC
jgi:hypothetical protein